MLKSLLGTTGIRICEEAGAAAAGGAASAAMGAGTQTGQQQGVTTTTTGEGGAAAPGGSATPSLAFLPGATPEDVGYAQSKGWDKSQNPAADIFKSYQNLEKLFGADKAGNAVIIPGENADPKDVNQFFQKLGRPEAADKYSAEPFKGMDDSLNKGLREKAFELGLSDKQVKGLAEWNNNAAEEMNKSLATAGAAEVAKQTEALKSEWGAAYDARVQAGAEAVKALGWTEEQINTMQLALGFDGVMKLAYNLSLKTGEGKFVGGEGGRSGDTTGGAMTPEQAKREMNKLSSDPEFMKAWADKSHPKHQEMVNRKSQLSKWSMGSK